MPVVGLGNNINRWVVLFNKIILVDEGFLSTFAPHAFVSVLSIDLFVKCLCGLVWKMFFEGSINHKFTQSSNICYVEWQGDCFID